jgi:hypothetical protein
MEMRMSRVEVFNRDPLELGPEVALHEGHELSGMPAKIKAIAIFRGDDDLPETPVAIALPAAEARGEIDLLLLGIETEAQSA